MPADVTPETFAPHVGTAFQVVLADDDRVELTLTEVSEVRSTPYSDAFSLIFRGPAERPLGQLEYRFEHAALGALALFIVPVGRPGDVPEYEAVFNHLRPQP